ncbi:MAG TPA: hypothetical protein VFJ74_08060 [Gemmatimonadaceae bacterium]|nr:hypothetical protein [Gemmatimonadaceae bacterium]
MQDSPFAPRAARPTRRAWRLAVAALIGVASTVGCYAYVPTAGAPVPSGSRVRVQLTDAGSTSLASYLGPSVVSVTGRLLASDDSVVNVAMSATQLSDGSEHYWNGEPVAVPRRLASTVQLRRFSGGRTALLSAAVGGLGYAIYASVGGVGGGGGSTTRTGGGGPK